MTGCVTGEMCTALDSVPFACVSYALEVRRKSDGATVAAQVSTLPALALRCALLLRAAGQRPGERRVSGTPDGSLSAATACSGVRRRRRVGVPRLKCTVLYIAGCRWCLVATAAFQHSTWRSGRSITVVQLSYHEAASTAYPFLHAVPAPGQSSWHGCSAQNGCARARPDVSRKQQAAQADSLHFKHANNIFMFALIFPYV